MTDDEMPDDLAAALREHSPRLLIYGPTFIKYAASPTGWLIVEPDCGPPVEQMH